MMLNQLVYTRCSPHRELRNEGQVSRNDGFGVFSMSEEIFSQQSPETLDFLQARFAVNNGSNETAPIGLFSSYEYNVLEPDVCIFSLDYARPHCKVPRANGQLHRSGTHIKQYLVGKMEGYPCEWFGASVWDAYLKSENDYYLDSDPKAVPEWLPQVSNQPAGGNVSFQKAAAFAKDGRQEAVKAAIWFLVQEYGKPEEERKVLLIKDTPENVELWIAAIEYAFSAQMARNIGFTTNRTQLGTQTENSLFYYADPTGKISRIPNRSITQKRRPYCMIVGYHPKDHFCTAVKPLPASNFVLLDGVTRQLSFVPDDSIQHPYYDAAVAYGEDIQDFCGYVLSSLPLFEVTPLLPKLYDAFQYLLDSNHKANTWEYSQTVSHIHALSQFGPITNDALNSYLLDQSLSVYSSMAGQDEKNGFALLQILWNLASQLHREREILGIVADRMQYFLNHLSVSSSELRNYWTSLKTTSMFNVIAPVLDELFNDTELAIYTKQLETAGPEAADIVLEMFLYTLRHDGVDLAAVLQNSTQYSFFCRSMVPLLQDQEMLQKRLTEVSSNRQFFYAMCISVADFLAKKRADDVPKWWNAVLNANGSDLVNFCRELCRCGKVDIQLIEQLLTSRMAAIGRYDPNIHRAFGESVRAIGAARNTGLLFYSQWIRFAKTSRDFEELLPSIRKAHLSREAEKILFQELDNKLPYDAADKLNGKVYQEIGVWAEMLGLPSKSFLLHHFQSVVFHSRGESEIVTAAAQIINAHIVVDADFYQEDYFRDICAKLADFGNNSKLHVVMLCLLESNDADFLYNYIDCYISTLLDHSKNKEMAENMIALCEAITWQYCGVPGRTLRQVNEMQKTANRVFADVLPHFYKKGLVDQVVRLAEDDDIKDKLVKMLQEAEKKREKQGIAGRLSRLGGFFGKR